MAEPILADGVHYEGVIATGRKVLTAAAKAAKRMHLEDCSVVRRVMAKLG